MTTGSGVFAQCGFAKESVKNTRATPTQFMGFVQESMRCQQNFIRSASLGGGLRYTPRKAPGTKEVGGSINFELQPETIIDLFELCLGGVAVTSGAGPYSHKFEGGDLATGTFQIVRPDAAGVLRPFDYVGCMVNQWTLTQNPDEYAGLQVELFAYDEVTNQSTASYAPDASPTPLTFQNLTVTPLGGSPVCFDSLTLTGSNGIARNYQSCAADGGRAQIREDGRRTLSGTVTGDFRGLTHYASYLAGTEGAMKVEWSAGASAKVTLDMRVFYTGETPNVGGPSVVKQGIGFEAVVGDGNDDADAITVTVVSTDTNA